MRASKPETKAKRRPRKQSAQPRVVLHKGLLERKGPFRNLIEIPGMEWRVLKRVEIYTATGHHSLTLDFEDQTSLTLLLDPCLFISAELADISSGSERILKRWPRIESVTG